MDAEKRKQIENGMAIRWSDTWEAKALRDCLDALDAAEAEIERLKIPKSGYEEMSARYAESMEECAKKLRESEAERERLEGARVRLFRKLRRVEAERDKWQRLCNEAEKKG
jgi:chromosome segregation ATPase